MAAFTLLATAGLIAPLLAADKDDKKSKEQDAIVGTWLVTTMDVPRAKPVGDDVKTTIAFTKDGKMTMSRTDRKEGVTQDYSLDPSTTPKAIDLTAGKATDRGIYELTGDDLKICIGDKDPTVRPKELKADGKTVVYIVLKRVKDDKKDK